MTNANKQKIKKISLNTELYNTAISSKSNQELEDKLIKVLKLRASDGFFSLKIPFSSDFLKNGDSWLSRFCSKHDIDLSPNANGWNIIWNKVN